MERFNFCLVQLGFVQYLQKLWRAIFCGDYFRNKDENSEELLPELATYTGAVSLNILSLTPCTLVYSSCQI
jgi:hypothetical protein